MKDLPDATNSINVLEKSLINRLLKRDPAAAQEFYQKYTPQLLGFIRRKVGDEQDVEEIAQDTLFGFLEGLRDFTHQCKISTYLCSIASRKIVDFYRKRKIKRIVFSQLPAGFESLISEVASPEDVYDQKLIGEKIKRVLNHLTPEYAKTLTLKYIEGRSVEEIAQILACSFKSAESILFRARKTFVKLYLSI